MFPQKLTAEKEALLAHLLEREGFDRLQTITPRRDLREAPLSYAQRRLLFLQQFDPDSPAYNLPRAFRVSGKLNIPVLKRTLSEIVRRHEILRTTFHVNGDEHLQVIHSPYDVSVPVIDLEHLPEVEREAEVEKFVVEEARRPFDLEHGPLLRAKLLRLAEDEYVALFTLHHIASDGWSTGLLVSEVQALYAAYSEDRPSPLAELPIQYADYARWQRDWFKGALFERHLAYWREHLRGAPATLTLPADRPRPAPRGFRGATYAVRLVSAEVAAELRRISREQGATLFMTLLTAFDTLLCYYTKQRDIVIGTPVGGRTRAETEPLIGFFINTLVLRSDFSGDPTFPELLQRVKNDLLGALAHQDVPFEKLVEELQPERNLSYTPLFQVSFTLQKSPGAGFTLPGLTLTPLGTNRGTTQYDLVMNLGDADSDLSGGLEYDTDLYDEETIMRVVQRFELVLREIVADPSARLSELLARLAAADAEQEKANEQQYEEFFTRKLAHTKRRGIRVS